MKRVAVLEKSVVHRIMLALRAVPGIVVRKRHGTVMGLAGDPDLYGTFRGTHFELEVKRPNDPASNVTKLQAERLAEWARAGAIAGVVRSVEDAMALLGLLEKQLAWICADCRKYRWLSEDAPARCPLCGHTRFEQETV